MNILFVTIALTLIALQIYLLIGFFFMVRYEFDNDEPAGTYAYKAFKIFLTWPWNRK